MKEKDQELGGVLVANTANKIQADFFISDENNNVFLPPERVLTERYDVSRSTMRRSLALLKNNGYIRPEHGRGYRILKKDTAKKIPRIAILQATDKVAISNRRTSQEIIDAMQRQSLKRKWQVLSIDVSDLNPKKIIHELNEANIQAVALVFEEKNLVDALLKEGIPCVNLENSRRELNIDYIFQDNYDGARKAANYLLSKEHKRIAWVGPISESYTSFARWSGAKSALVEKGLDISDEDTITESQQLEKAVKKFLSKKNRPNAILALWERHLVAVIKTANELKLKIGKDLDVVGWSNETKYQVLINEILPKKSIPPMVVWSPDEMAEVAITRLILHWQEPGLNPLHIGVPAKLILPKKK